MLVGARGCANRRVAVVTDCLEQLLCPLNKVVPPAKTVNVSRTVCVVMIALNTTNLFEGGALFKVSQKLNRYIFATHLAIGMETFRYL